jgi:hypothetical protein
MKYSLRLFLQVVLMILVAVLIEAGCSGQIPFGDPEGAPGIVDILPPISVDEVSKPTPAEGETATPAPEGAVKAGAIIAGCSGMRLQNPQQKYTDAAELLVIPGRSALEQCADMPVLGLSLPGVIVAPAQKNQWLGGQVVLPVDDRHVLANDFDSPTLRTIYRLYDYDGTALVPGAELKTNHPFIPYNGFQLSVLEDMSGDELKDFIVITADDSQVESTYYIEFFPGSDQGIDTVPKNEIKVSDQPMRRPLWVATSPDGLIAVAYPFDDITLRVVVFDGKTMQKKGFARFRLFPEGSCGLAFVKLPVKGDAIAVCLSEDKDQVGKVYVKALSNFDAVPSPLPPKALTFPTMIFHPAPMRLKTLDGNLFVLSPGHVGGFTPTVLEGMSNAADPWDQAAISFGIKADDYPLDILPADYNGDEVIETLIPVRSGRDAVTSPAKVLQKIFMESGEPPCRILEFDSCHHPEVA